MVLGAAGHPLAPVHPHLGLGQWGMWAGQVGGDWVGRLAGHLRPAWYRLQDVISRSLCILLES